MAATDTADVQSADIKSTYESIQNWILNQQEYEAEHSAPAPLTPKQLKALQNLEREIRPVAETGPEPDLGAENWIGLLTEHTARHQKTTRDLVFTETSLPPDVAGQIKHRCRVRIPWRPEAAFPDGTGGPLPAFARKKSAKAYAARCAVAWLRETGRMAAGGGKPTTTTTTTTAPHPLRSPPTSAPAPKRQQTRAFPFDPDDDDGGGPSAVQRVAEACGRLNAPAPRYVVVAEEEEGGGGGGRAEFFGAHAVFADHGVGVGLYADGAGAGHVAGVYTRAAARERVAEKLLPRLREEEERRVRGRAGVLREWEARRRRKGEEEEEEEEGGGAEKMAVDG
ncbi:hypothetical protein F4780DRAFT_554799 [Xylariomycetidae sp. FL0641]|nr:hypothetical protein F4780DRAFT_554799 [Xylariomycetidae sp. FL0641]